MEMIQRTDGLAQDVQLARYLFFKKKLNGKFGSSQRKEEPIIAFANLSDNMEAKTSDTDTTGNVTACFASAGT